MSTAMIPDIYRPTARKSTVSRNVKPASVNVSICDLTLNINNNSKQEQSIFDTMESDVKLEKDIPQQQEQSFIILPDNEIEQMIVENIEQAHEEIICDILEQIKNQIHEDFLNRNQIENFNRMRMLSTDIHTVVDLLMNHFDDNDETSSSAVDVPMDDINRSLDEGTSMESDQQSSILSRSQVDDDIVEIGVPASNTNPQLCTCQCHQTTTNCSLTNPTNEYLLFEEALRQTRQEQQHERSLNNNPLLQTLKRQHQELMNFYQKQINITKIDREQQTIKINQSDSQIQTDLTIIQQNPKPNIQAINGTHSTPNLKGLTTTNTRPYSSFLTTIRTTGPSLQQLIPCLSTGTTATTTTLTNKTSVVKTTTSVATTNSHPQPLPPPPPPLPPLLPTPPSSSPSVSHDIVDLTEEDDDDGTNRVPTQVPVPVRQVQQNTTSQNPSTSLSTATTTRIQLPIRAGRPITTAAPGQTFPLRPLSDHTPCDHTIARPQLSIAQDNTTVRLTWNLSSTPMESVQNYEIYAYKQTATVAIADWKKIGTVKSMRLPMAVTLKEFQSNSHYAFAVRAISINNNIGPFCEPKTIFTGNTSVQPLHASQLLNVST